MVTTSANHEQAVNQLRRHVEALPDDNPRKALLTELLSGQDAPPEARHAQQEAVRRIALERYHALPDADPLKGVLGRLLAGPEPAAPPVVTGDGADLWRALEVLRQRDDALFKGIQTVDARSAAAMEEAQRLAAKAVELQEFLNMVLEEVHMNTAMLKSLKEALPKP